MSPSTASDPFRDFDDKLVFDELNVAIQSPDSLNFVLDFNTDQALCAFDLTDDGFKQALDDRVSRLKVGTRMFPPWVELSY